MEIPGEYILTMDEVYLNINQRSGEINQGAPFIGEKHDRVYGSKYMLSGLSAAGVLDELRRHGDLGALVGPIIDVGHFQKTWEVREIIVESLVSFWLADESIDTRSAR